VLFQIKEIILWPKKTTLKPRRVQFKIGALNVISGWSRTGKSAIIPIIDYCLGADKCTIPVETIRDATEWFGVVVATEFGDKLFARKGPGLQKTTTEAYVLEAETDKLVLPAIIAGGNTNVGAIKKSLDQLAGLTNLDFNPTGSDSGFLGRPSFRDLSPFVFQPQNVIANPNVLFYKADSFEHREKLRTIFPYVLNAITADLLAKKYELEKLSKELRRKRSELTTIREISAKWMAEIRSKVSEARELGLIKTTVPDGAPREQLVDLLKGVVASPNQREATVTATGLNDAVKELVGLQQEESRVSLQLSQLRRRLAEMTALRENSKQYAGALNIQRDRLKVSSWLKEIHDTHHGCPVCGQEQKLAGKNLDTLCTALEGIEDAAGKFGAIPVAFDREMERVRTDLQSVADSLEGVKARRQAVERLSDSAKQSHYDSLRISRFVGGIEQALEIYSQIGVDSNLDADVRGLELRVAALQAEISEGAIRAKTKRAVEAVNLHAGKLIPKMDVERPNDPISLYIEELTIKVKKVEREDYLWEIGSGSNWLGYHLAVSLALQQYFTSLPASPVPSFVVYDQPSQVYFPRRPASDEASDPKWTDADIAAVRKAFKIMASVVKDLSGKLQVIVLDHAGEDVWGEIKDIYKVEEWRNGRSLIPESWLDKP
jgi:hypothetical protein